MDASGLFVQVSHTVARSSLHDRSLTWQRSTRGAYREPSQAGYLIRDVVNDEKMYVEVLHRPRLT
jgi:hypothetical protein